MRQDSTVIIPDGRYRAVIYISIENTTTLSESKNSNTDNAEDGLYLFTK